MIMYPNKSESELIKWVSKEENEYLLVYNFTVFHTKD